VNNEIGQFAQAFGALVEITQHQVRREPFLFGHLPRAFQAVHRGEGYLVLLRVLAGRFAQGF
jgi:hypothetical protein